MRRAGGLYVVLTALSAGGIGVTGIEPGAVAPIDDAGVVVADSSYPDSSTPTNQDDGSGPSPIDAGPEAAPVDAGKSFCASLSFTPAFCQDFDLLPNGVYKATTTNGTEMGVKDEFVVGANGFTLDFDFQLTSIPKANDGLVSLITLVPKAGFLDEIFFFMRESESYCQQGGQHFSVTRAAPTRGARHHFALKLTTTGSNTLVDATMDDDIVYWKNDSVPDKWPVGSTAVFKVGIARYYQADAADLWIDNLVVRNLP